MYQTEMISIKIEPFQHAVSTRDDVVGIELFQHAVCTRDGVVYGIEY